MAVLSVNSMIRHAKGNAKLYEEMVALGYSDDSFPVWWYSPGREGTEAKTVGQGGTTLQEGEQGGTTLQEGEQIAGRGTELQEGEDFAPTPPDTPVPKEARPALPESSPSSPSQPVPSPSSQGVPSSSSFSEAELSLLNERGITEITPGQWMRTVEQADGRIVLTRAR